MRQPHFSIKIRTCSKAQFDKSLGDLTVKMRMTGLAEQACYNDFII